MPSPPAPAVAAAARPVAPIACSVVAVQLGAMAIAQLTVRTGLAIGLATAAGVAAVTAVRWARCGRRVRALLAFATGLAAIGAGVATAIPRIALAGPTAIDALGIAGTLAGAVLVVSATRLALRGRRRWLQVYAGVAGAFIVLQWWVWPLLGAGLATTAALADAAGDRAAVG